MPRQKKTVLPSAVAKLPPDVKPVIKKLAKGEIRIYYYRRVTKADGKPGLVRIEGEPGSIEFEASYQAAGLATDAYDANQLSGIIKLFKLDPDNNHAKPDSIKQRNAYLARIEDEFGNMTVGDLQDDRAFAEMKAWRNGMQATPVAADIAVRTLRQVLKWARSERLIRFNQADDIKELVDKRQRLARSRAKILWQPEFQAALFEYANEPLRKAFLLASFLGCRPFDLCELRWSQIDEDGWLRFTPQKTVTTTGVEVAIPTFALPPLAELLTEMPRYGTSNDSKILTTILRREIQQESLRNSFCKARAKAVKAGHPIGHLHWHDIRGTTVTRLLRAGCSHAEVAAITGHALTSGQIRSGAGNDEPVAPSIAAYGAADGTMAQHAYERWTRFEFSDRGQVVTMRPRSA